MRPRPLRHAGLALLLLLSVGAAGGPALAAPDGPAPQDRAAGDRAAGDRAAVEREIAELERSTAHGDPLAEPLGRARKVLSRALSMERAGDVGHAARAVAAAHAWVNVARDVVRVLHAEGAAVLAEKKHEEALTRLTRSRALLEESVARRGRAAAVLADLEAKPEAPTTTAPTPKAVPVEPAPAAPAPGTARPAQDTRKPPQDTNPAPQDTKKPPQGTNPAPPKAGGTP